MSERLEKETEDEIVAYVKSLGGEALKLKIEGQRGFPDRTLLLPGAIILFIETKRLAGVMAFLQTKWKTRLTELGFVALTVTTLDETKRAVDKISSTRLSKTRGKLEP